MTSYALKRRVLKFTAMLILFFLFSINAFSETISDSVYNFSLDIPEGFELNDVSDDQMSYHFKHPNYPVQFIIKIYENPSFNSSQMVLATALKKLGAAMEIDTFAWNNSPECAISDFSMTLDQKYSGWAICAPLQKSNSFVTVLAYSTADTRQSCNPFIMSILNSLCTDENYYCFPGIIATYAYPLEGKKNIKLNIGGNTITSYIDNSDIDAAQFVLEMEYSVLLLYAKHNLWKEAWQRYYRMVYRDSYGRLAQVSYDIISQLYPVCEQSNPSNPDLAYAQALLSWVQGFQYKRDNEKSTSTDFTNLPAVLCGTGNDCDSRSMLVCVFLRAAGLESFMIISREYSHAMVTFENQTPGQKYEVEGTGRSFLMGETTAKVTWGTIAQEHADRSKWIPVIMP